MAVIDDDMVLILGGPQGRDSFGQQSGVPGRERAGKVSRFPVTLAATVTTVILLALAGSLVNPQP